jgi:hypothetical protein
MTPSSMCPPATKMQDHSFRAVKYVSPHAQYVCTPCNACRCRGERGRPGGQNCLGAEHGIEKLTILALKQFSAISRRPHKSHNQQLNHHQLYIPECVYMAFRISDHVYNIVALLAFGV